MFKPDFFGCLPSSGLKKQKQKQNKKPDDGKQPKTFGINILIF